MGEYHWKELALFLGFAFATFVAYALFLSPAGTLCPADAPDCWREWVAALSGWAAAGAALITFGVLLEQLRHARSSSQHELRAYMGMTESHLVNVESRPRAKVTLKNWGKTAARNVRTFAVWLEVGDYERRLEPLGITVIGRPANQIGAVAPGQEDDYYFPAEYLIENRKLITGGAVDPRLLVRVEYDDAFGFSHTLAFILHTELIDGWNDHELNLSPPGYQTD